MGHSTTHHLSKFLNNSSYSIQLSAHGQQIVNNIDPYGTYYIVVDTYTQLYRQNGLTLVEYYDETTYARDLLAEAIKNGRLGSTLDDEENADDFENYTLTSVADLLSLGTTLGPNEYSKDYYFIEGEIIDTPNPKYGNLTLEDENGDCIYIYGLYDIYNNRYDNIADKPTLGDRIVVYARVFYYVNPNDPDDQKIELKNAMLLYIVN